MRNLEYVKDIQEGLGNVTKPYFLFPYAFIGSKSQLEYVTKTNYTDDKLGKRSALHISDQCFAMFGVSFAYQLESVYRQRFNDGILLLQQSGIILKIRNDVRWDMYRSKAGRLLQISAGKTLKMNINEERGLTLADTEGMFLLLGIGFLIAGGVLISEWVGGCTNKCMQFMKLRKEQREEQQALDHRIDEIARLDEEARMQAEDLARNALQSASSIIGLTMKHFVSDIDVDNDEAAATLGFKEDEVKIETNKIQKAPEIGSNSSRSSHHSRASSVAIADVLNSAMLEEMYHGPKNRHSNIIMINGKMMSEASAYEYSNHEKEIDERTQRGNHEGASQISKNFDFLDREEDEDEIEQQPSKVCQVEINLQAPSPHESDGVDEKCFGEKIDDGNIVTK